MKRAIPLDTSTYMRNDAPTRLTDLAEKKGWVRDGFDGHFPKFKKGEIVISICNTCGGGFVKVIEPTANTHYRNDAVKFLQDA